MLNNLWLPASTGTIANPPQTTDNHYSSSRSTFTPTKSSHPCPICHDITGKCRIVSDDFVLCMTHPTDADIPEWRYLGETKGSYYAGKYVAVRVESETERQQQRETARRMAAARQKAQQQRFAQLPAIAQRDRQWRDYLATLTLNAIDRTDLYDRGFNDAQIEAIGFKSLDDGYITPIRTPRGQIIGAQLRRRKIVDGGRYRWHKPYGWDIHLPNGDVPIAFYWPFGTALQGIPDRIVLVEGTGVKPARAANLLNIPAIGAAGGNFTASKHLLQEYFTEIGAVPGNTRVLIAPDGGDIHNSAVLKRLQKTLALLRSLGYETDALWWGQLTKQDGDIDELEDTETIAAIPFHEFLKLGDRYNQRTLEIQALLSRVSPQPKPSAGFAPSPLDRAIVTEYGSGERLDTWARAAKQGFKYILDISQTGSGKSFDAGKATPELFSARQVIYSSDQHRNVTTPTLKAWPDLEARHNGLTIDANGKTRRAKTGDRLVEPSNCGRADAIARLREKGISSTDSEIACQTCPLLNACRHGRGDGYGFKHERREVLAQDRLRSHPASLPDPSEYTYANVVQIWEEADANFSTSRKLDVCISDIDAAIVHLSTQAPTLFQQLQPLLTELRALLTEKQPKFGYDLRSLRQFLPVAIADDATLRAVLQPILSGLDTIDEIDETEFNGLSSKKLRQMASLSLMLKRATALKSHEAEKYIQQETLKQWLPEFLDILTRDDRGYAAIHAGKLKLTLPDWRLRAIAADSKLNICLSATWSQAETALVLGCKPDEIFVCRQAEAPDMVKPDIIQIADLGRMGMQRGADRQRRLEALVNHYQSQDPTTQAIDFKKFGANWAWWRDSRGLNDFANVRTLIVVGTPCRNLLDLLAEYTTLTGKVTSTDDSGFKAFVDRLIYADIQQCFGRKMGARCQQGDLIVFVSDFNLGLSTTIVKSADITIEAASKTERVKHGIKQAIASLSGQGKKVTQAAIAKFLGMTRAAISHYSESIFLLLETLDSKKIQNSPPQGGDEETCQSLAQVVYFVVNSGDPMPEILAAIHEIFFDWIPLRWRRWLIDCLDAQTHAKLIGYFALATM
jgi:hypothetical protein